MKGVESQGLDDLQRMFVVKRQPFLRTVILDGAHTFSVHLTYILFFCFVALLESVWPVSYYFHYWPA